METLLFLSDYRIVEAIDARGVIERARRLRPRVLVMPVSLPGMEPGGGAIRVLKEDPPLRDLRIIAISEHEDVRGERMASELGVDALVYEPCLPAEIVGHVRRCILASAATARTQSADRKRPSDRMEARKSSRPRERDPKASL